MDAPSQVAHPLGVGIVGCGNIAGGYALDLAAHPEVRLVAAADLDPERAAAFAQKHGCRAHPSVAELLADPEVELVINLTVHHAHYALTKQALEAGRHVYSEKPLTLVPAEARELVALADETGVRLGCSPCTFLGEAQQTVGRLLAEGRIGTVRAIFANVAWGRIEAWHPAPQPFYDVGALVDVGVYPLTIVTAFLGPVRSVRAMGWELEPERVTTGGTPFRIGSPDLVIAALELESGSVVRLTTSFYVGKPAKGPAAIEFHGDLGAIAIDNFQEFDAAVELGSAGSAYEPVALVREPYRGTAWARGVVDMARAISEDRPHRVTGEQAAHVVDILWAAGESMRTGASVAIDSDFARAPLMDWAGSDVAAGEGSTGAVRSV
jgi:predicted dehydrogenase